MPQTPDPTRDLIFEVTTADTVSGVNVIQDPVVASEGASADLLDVKFSLGGQTAGISVSGSVAPTLTLPPLVATETASAEKPLLDIGLGLTVATESGSAQVETTGGLTIGRMVFFGRYKVYNSDRLGEVALRKLSWLRGETR